MEDDLILLWAAGRLNVVSGTVLIECVLLGNTFLSRLLQLPWVGSATGAEISSGSPALFQTHSPNSSEDRTLKLDLELDLSGRFHTQPFISSGRLKRDCENIK